MNDQLALKILGLLHYFLGFEVIKTQVGLHMRWSKYARDLLVKTNMQDSKPALLLVLLMSNFIMNIVIGLSILSFIEVS